MNLRQNRNDNARAILEGKFISRVLKAEGEEIDHDIEKRMSGAGFRSDFWQDRSFSIVGSGSTLEYRHRKQNRFVDMKTRNTETGKRRKKSHPVHNKPVYGHLNNIAHELSFGFTEAIIAEIKQLEKE